MSKKAIAYEATITMQDNPKWIIERPDLKSLKEDAIKASLLWKPFYYMGSIESGIKIIRIYRISPVSPGSKHMYRDMVGVCANGHYIPVRIWWLMKEWYKKMPDVALLWPRIHQFIETHIRETIKNFETTRDYNDRKFIYPPKDDAWGFVHLDYSCWRNHIEHKGE